jgi:phosphoglycolate phosphatase-like HAD superfamily hydrolase
VEHAKPAPDLLLRAAEELTVAPARTWYVGDATWDMLAAVAAGMPAIGVTTGAVGTAELESSGASLVVASLDELLAHMADAGLLRGD